MSRELFAYAIRKNTWANPDKPAKVVVSQKLIYQIAQSFQW